MLLKRRASPHESGTDHNFREAIMDRYIDGVSNERLRQHLNLRFCKTKYLENRPSVENLRERTNEFYRYGQRRGLEGNAEVPKLEGNQDKGDVSIGAKRPEYKSGSANEDQTRKWPVCYRCNKVGHMSRECPGPAVEKQKLAAVGDPIDNSEDRDQEFLSEEVVVAAMAKFCRFCKKVVDHDPNDCPNKKPFVNYTRASEELKKLESKLEDQNKQNQKMESKVVELTKMMAQITKALTQNQGK